MQLAICFLTIFIHCTLIAYVWVIFFDNILFKIIDGIAMGSSLEPTWANSFLCNYKLHNYFGKCPLELKPFVYRRDVDGVFALLKSKNHLLSFARYMNTRYKNLKFTFNFEQNKSFSILDVKITCGSKRFSTSIFRKATFSGVLLLSIIKQVLFSHYCFGVSQVAQIC